MAALPLIFYDAMMRPDVALRKQTGMCPWPVHEKRMTAPLVLLWALP